ncbi:MAG: hypothetical protein AB7R55_01555 [Gemmatimonadales bacterium]
MWIVIAISALLALPARAQAQLKCCYQVTAVDTRTGLVSATEATTGSTLKFQVRDRVLLARLRVSQQVYVDLSARQVSLDGRQSCCAVVGTPVTAAPRAASPPPTAVPPPAPAPGARAQVPSPVARVGGAYPKPSIAYGTPYKPTTTRVPSAARVQSRSVTGIVNGRSTTGTVVEVRGRKGIEQATGLSPGVRTLLGMHVRTLAVGEPATYLVNTQLAEQWIQTHPVPASMKPIEPETDDGDDCNGVISMNCAQQAVEQTLEQAWEMTAAEFERFRKRATDAWNDGAKQLSLAWNETQACFTEDVLSLPDIPVRFAITPSMAIDLEQSKSKGSASGSVKGRVTVGIPMEADFAAQLDLFYIPCLPFAVRPRALSADGVMTVGEALAATVTATGSFRKQYTIPPTGGPVIPIQVFPIVIAGVPVSEIDVSAYVEGNIEVSADGQADGRFQIESANPTRFSFSCSGSGCRAAAKGAPAPTSASQGAQIQGRVSLKPAIYTALQLNFNYQALSARAGPQPYLLGAAWGCGAVAASQTSGGPTTAQTNHALTGDLDWGVELRAEALVMRNVVGSPFVTSLMRGKHLWFRDLAPGGSTAFVPLVTSPSQVVAGQPVVYRVRMPTCYPYLDKVTYQVSWTGNATPAATAGCQWQSGRGACSFAPGADLVLSLTWPAAGSHSLTVRAIGDGHGRAFAPAPPAAQVSVTAGSP